MASPIKPAHGATRLTIEAVRIIRAANTPQKVLALEHGITEASVSMIRRRKRWGFVK